jgi:hypothetical protein
MLGAMVAGRRRSIDHEITQCPGRIQRYVFLNQINYPSASNLANALCLTEILYARSEVDTNDESKDTKATWWGNYCEPIIREGLSEVMGWRVEPLFAVFSNNCIPSQSDGMILNYHPLKKDDEEERGIVRAALEIKAPYSGTIYLDYDVMWFSQAQCHMRNYDVDYTVLAIYVPTGMVVYEIERCHTAYEILESLHENRLKSSKEWKIENLNRLDMLRMHCSHIIRYIKPCIGFNKLFFC